MFLHQMPFHLPGLGTRDRVAPPGDSSPESPTLKLGAPLHHHRGARTVQWYLIQFAFMTAVCIGQLLRTLLESYATDIRVTNLGQGDFRNRTPLYELFVMPFSNYTSLLLDWYCVEQWHS